MSSKLVMIPGPTPVTRSIQDALGRSTAAFGDPAFVADFKSVLADLKTLWQTAGEVFVVAGTGTMAMEMAIANTLKTGDAALVVSHGFFGDRFVNLCRRRGIVVDTLTAEWGKAISPAEIEAQLKTKNYRAVTVTHVDTSTGVRADIEEIGRRVRKFNDTIYIVDGVCATAGEPEAVDEMNIDVLFTGSQKAFGVAPGLCMLWAGPRTLERRKSMGTIPEFYIDFESWIPTMHDPLKYFATPAVNLIWGLQESLRLIKAEGLPARCARHRRYADAIQAALETLGFKHLAAPEHRAATLSTILYPPGVDDAAFRKSTYDDGVVVAGGLAAYAGKMFRMGHMGNIGIPEVVTALSAIERALAKTGRPVTHGAGVGEFLKRVEK